MVGHSPIPRFDSTFCGETIVSKTAQESGCLYELSGTAVSRVLLRIDPKGSTRTSLFGVSCLNFYGFRACPNDHSSMGMGLPKRYPW